MILYPLTSAENRQREAPQPSTGTPISAWKAVEQKQHQSASSWWLIAQPDHAQLAADLAASLNSPLIPQLEASTLRAIGLHDAGWVRFDDGQRGAGSLIRPAFRPKLKEGRPISFLDLGPVEFLPAWRDSIAEAKKVDAIGGVLVSRHFCRLAEHRLNLRDDSSENSAHLRTFLRDETARQQSLLRENRRPAQEVNLLTDVLQFFDLLSLYLCCGADDYVEFPQKFRGQAIRLRRIGRMFQSEPALFGTGASLGVTARRDPLQAGQQFTTLAFLLT